MSTPLQLMNAALLKAGISQLLQSTSESTREAFTASECYEPALRETLRAAPWDFAKRNAALVLKAGSVLAPVARDYTYGYGYPDDCGGARRLVPARATGRAVNYAPLSFRIGRNATGADSVWIYANEADAELEYTAFVNLDLSRFHEPLFEDALTWNLASKVAPSLSRIEGITEKCLQAYTATVQLAANVALREAQLPTVYTLAREALLKLGVPATIASAEAPSNEASTAAALLDETILEVLCEFPWAFATKYATLDLLAGSTTTAVNDDWQFMYTLPTDCVRARRLTTPVVGRGYSPSPGRFRVGRSQGEPSPDPDVRVLFAHVEDATLEYTARIDDSPEYFSDPLFRDAVTWRLAAKLAPAFAPKNPKMPDLAIAMYDKTLIRAKALDANEQQQESSDGDADWIAGR